MPPNLAASFHPYSRDDQTRKGPAKGPSKKDMQAVYDAATEAARDPKTGYLICALCGKPGTDEQMHRDHVRTRGASGGTKAATTVGNIRIVHHDCHMKSHQSGDRQREKKNALTDEKPKRTRAKKASTT